MYRIQIPKTVEEAYAIDQTMGTTFWHDAIEKEMKNVRTLLLMSWWMVWPHLQIISM